MRRKKTRRRKSKILSLKVSRQLILIVATIIATLILLEVQAALTRRNINRTDFHLTTFQEDTSETFQDIKKYLINNSNQLFRVQEQVGHKLGYFRKEIDHQIDDLLLLNIVQSNKYLHGLKELKNLLRRDKEKLYQQILLPSVRIRTSDGVGGGTIIYSKPDWQGIYHTYVLTAYHVIHKLIQHTKKGVEIRRKSQVDVYQPDLSNSRTFSATVISYHKTKDLALLKIDSERQFKYTARLVRRAYATGVKIFTPVYTVGCPLGNEPMPTAGEIAGFKQAVNGESFWLMNAPTIFGNSGGGVFLTETNEFIGISSMISVYNNMRIPIPVSHLGLMIPPKKIFDWLDSQHLQFLYNANYSKGTCDIMRYLFKKINPFLLVTKE